MATATSNQGKSSFVKEFLSDHPEGNVRSVNEAWTSAGMTGSIGDTLIYQTRADMGLSGKKRAKSKPKTTAKAKSPTRVSEPASSPGKSMFVKEFLNDHPQGNAATVNEAWHAARFDGTISPALVNQMRAKLGLNGNLRGSHKRPKPSPTGKKRGRPRKDTAAAVNGTAAAQPRAKTTDRTSALLGVEAEIDRLIFTVMGIENLPEIETVLREARRKLYGALSN
jgi:hypothetical protein